jgi:hypothetical protein
MLDCLIRPNRLLLLLLLLLLLNKEIRKETTIVESNDEKSRGVRKESNRSVFY